MQALDKGPPLNVAQLADRFGVEDVLQTKDRAFMTSLLYYSGMLTLAGYTSLGKLAFRVPNLVVRRLYVEQLGYAVGRVDAAIAEIARNQA